MSKPKPMPSYWALAEEVTHLHGQIEKLQAENAKLRELVRDMWHDLQVHGYKVENMLRARYEHRMRELGVEV